MSKTSLKASIATVVKTNGVRSITGANLRGKLNEIVDEIYPTADATALDGTEVIIVQQGGERKETTTQDIADLGGGGDTWLTLGTFTFADVNAGAAAATITLSMTTNQIPVNSIIEYLAFDVTTEFDAPTELFDAIGAGGFSNIPVVAFNVVSKNILGYRDYTNATTQFYSSAITPAYNFAVELTFLTSNPQDYTQGSCTIKALIRQFP